MSDVDLTALQRDIKAELPGTTVELAAALSDERTPASVRAALNRMKPLVDKDEDLVWRWVGPEEDDDGPEDLTDREAYILRELPADTDELAADLNIATAVVDAHLSSISEKGWEVQYDANAECWYTDGETKRRIGSRHMGTITRQANNWLTAAEDELIRRLRTIEPNTVDVHTEPGNEDVVAVLSDVHVGQDVEDENGNVIYGEPEWRGAIRWFGRKCLSIPEQMRGLENVDTFYLLLNGDIVTNENIYVHQPEDVGAYISDQIDISTEELIHVITSLADNFDALKVICQVGNHGEMRASGQTRQANADLFVYRNLKRAMHFSPYDNVEFQVGDATKYKRFDLRGGKWQSLATHGEAAYEQITGTSASDSQMQNWRGAFRKPVDVFYLSHYHEYRDASVNGVRAVRAPSAKPGGKFEFEIGKLEASNAVPEVGMIHGVSDDRPVTWRMPIDLIGSGVFGGDTYPILDR